MDTPDILKRITARKAEEVAERKRRQPLAELTTAVEQAGPGRGFADALAGRIAAGRAAVIAEIKRASPSKGLLREDFRPADIAASYMRAGAACLCNRLGQGRQGSLALAFGDLLGLAGDDAS